MNNQEFIELDTNTAEFKKLMAHYTCAMMEIETKFNVLNEEFSLKHDMNPINSIKRRLKKPIGIYNKMIRKGYEYSLENVEKYLYDVAGVRVVCTFLDDVYTIADSLLAQDDIVLIEKKDYIKNPKPNGYRSLHLIVEVPIFLKDGKKMMKVEIQLRTIAMDWWASLEHQLRYKKMVELEKHMSDELKACAEVSESLDLRMNSLKDEVWKKIKYSID